MLTEESAANGRRTGGSPPTPKPNPPLTFDKFIESETVPGNRSGARVPPVAGPRVVVNSPPVPGGPITPVKALVVMGPVSKTVFKTSLLYNVNVPPEND